ncbi:hypothetical protein NG895_24435 [Aeoliella sp. ICT_H6.2]|uniref:Uncharacterized protein n=2 Tax=Aeoliella straminimaris TaxID=2954799 RepID=A0A9X2FF34_9BACT|nr:hypothetical protein [Aeoliella straminimaris]MCO6047058.1 hypothetical protein [Aeoliella straminimaris]
MSTSSSHDAYHQAHVFADHYHKSKTLESIEHEICLMRAIIEAKLQELQDTGNDPNEALQALTPALQTVARLVKTQQEISERCNQALRKDTLAELAKVLIAAVTDEIIDLPEGPERLERIANRFTTAIDQATNA